MGETLEETEVEHWVPLVHGEMAGDGRSTADRETVVDLGMGCPTRRTRPNPPENSPTRPEEFDGRARVKIFDPV